MHKINLDAAFRGITEHWSPRIAAEVNATHVKLARLKGSFDWHHHADEDELFLVLEGRLCLELRDREVWLEAGEMMVVPRGVEHRPVAPEECRVLLVEPKGTLNTGTEVTERTVAEPAWVDVEAAAGDAGSSSRPDEGRA